MGSYKFWAMAKASIETVISRAWETYKKNWLSICIAILLIGIIEGVIIGIGLMPLFLVIFSMLASGISGPEAFSMILAQWQSLIFSIAFAAVFFTIALLVGVALRGGLTGMFIHALRKKKVSYSTFFPIARARWKSFIGVGLITGLITILFMAVFLGPGFLLMLAGDTVGGVIALIVGVLIFIPVAIIIGVLFAFAYIAVIVNKLGAIPAIKASVRFGMRNFWATLAIIVIFTVLSVLASMLDLVTYVLGSILIYFAIVPLQILSLAALYLGRKKGRR